MVYMADRDVIPHAQFVEDAAVCAHLFLLLDYSLV